MRMRPETVGATHACGLERPACEGFAEVRQPFLPGPFSGGIVVKRFRQGWTGSCGERAE